MPQYYKLIEEVPENEVAQHVKRMLENSGISENRASLAQILLFANYGGFRSEFNEAALLQLDMQKHFL